MHVLSGEYEAALERLLVDLDAERLEAVVAVAELPDLVRGYESLKVERIAVRPRWRGRGYAKEIVAFMLDHAIAQGAKKFKMHAQVYLEDFYAGYGFRREGPVFDECGIDHILMIREDA